MMSLSPSSLTVPPTCLHPPNPECAASLIRMGSHDQLVLGLTHLWMVRRVFDPEVHREGSLTT
jgi:hypothetical protein